MIKTLSANHRQSPPPQPSPITVTIDEAIQIGVGHHEAGRTAEAESIYRQVLALHPDHPDALTFLGVLTCQAGHPDTAIELIGRAAAILPTAAGIHFNLGGCYREAGRWHEAIASYRRAIELGPAHAETHVGLAAVLNEVGQHEEAVAACRRVLAIEGEHVGALLNMGSALVILRQFDDAMAAYHRVIAIQPDFAEVHTGLGHALLARGNLDQGWAELGYVERRLPLPPGAARWIGEPLDGDNVALYCEMGLGDIFQFVRYAPLVHARGGRVVLICPSATADGRALDLVPVLSTVPGVERVVPDSAPLPCRYHAGLMSLPAILKTTLDTIPPSQCIHADPQLVELWRSRLANIPGFRVGCCWAGTAGFLDNPYRCRSYPLRHLAALARIPGVSLISLQVVRGLDELRGVDFPIVDLGGALTATPGAFMDAAAVVQNLDLVVTCDTGFAHFAGALGVRTWTALPYSACWRWLLGRSDTPWYETMRLFRQSAPGDWQDVFERMAEALRAVTLEPSGWCGR